MKFFEHLAELEGKREPFALVTITETRGTVPRKAGRMAVDRRGNTCGTVGGGDHEARAKELALECLKKGKGRKATIPVGDRGEMEVMIDVPEREKKVVILGMGHVGQEEAKVLSALGWKVTAVDYRAELEDAFPFFVLHDQDESPLAKLSLDSSTAVLINSAAFYGKYVEDILRTDVFYVGLLSSRTREWPQDKRVHAPMGLDLGEKEVEEIALSVASELLAEWNGRKQRSNRDWRRELVVVRGAGDLATGAIVRLHNAGLPIIALETDRPTVIRRTVAFADVVYEGTRVVEGVTCRLAKDTREALDIMDEGDIPLIIDPEGKTIEEVKPAVVVDAIIAKRNLGTTMAMAPLVVAMGPGFEAGKDCHVVVETMRGHKLGRLIYSGAAMPNTGTPGIIGGKGKERVVHSPHAGLFRGVAHIGDIVTEGQTIAYVDETPVLSSLDGRLRGLLHDGLTVPDHFKIADVDPRGAETDHTTISDKARALGGAVLEAVDNYLRNH